MRPLKMTTERHGILSAALSVVGLALSAVKNGHIRRVIDDEVKSLVLEISGTNVATTYITCPIKPRASLAIRLPFLVMIVKNMKKYFTFEIQILDDKDMHRRFRVSNFQSTTKVRPFCTTMPIGLSSGWNQIQFNLADFTRRAYGTLYLETMRIQLHANVRIRRIYFADRLYSEDEMPSEYRLFVPLSTKRDSKVDKEVEKELVDVKGSKGSKLHEPPAEPSGAPPSPVGTEPALGGLHEEVQMSVQQYEGEEPVSAVTEEGKTETEITEMTEDVPPSEEPASDVPPSEEPEVAAPDEGGEAPTEEGAAEPAAGAEGGEPTAAVEPAGDVPESEAPAAEGGQEKPPE